MKHTAIDLFAGCGGLSLGFIKNEYIIKSAVEFDNIIARTYNRNHPETKIIVDDIKNIDIANTFKLHDADVIIGGPPCQGFSMAGARIREGFVDDPRNYLFKHYLSIVKTVRPKAFVFENVKGILTMQNGKIFNEIINSFSSKELFGEYTYNVKYKIIKAVDFGIPQKRERVIIIGVLQNINCEFDTKWENTKQAIKKEKPHFFDKVNVYDAISNLPPVTEDGIIENPPPITEYQKYLSCDNKYLENHYKTNHSTIAINRMKQVKGGENFTSIPEKINSVHSGSYGRLCWDEPAPTITTRFDTPAGGRFTHPTENRTLTPREGARLQSFPDDFIFYGNRTSIYKQIGNAVPPKISYFLSRFIDSIIAGE